MRSTASPCLVHWLLEPLTLPSPQRGEGKEEGRMQKIFEILTKPVTDFFRIGHLVFFSRMDPCGQIASATNELMVTYSSGFSAESIRSLQELKEKADVFRRVIDTRIPQVINDITETEKSLFFLAESENLKSMIAVPVYYGEKLWGILTAFSQEKFRFKEEDAKIVTLFSGQIGELVQLFSRYLQDTTDDLLVQILGSIELLNFRYKNWEVVPLSEILDAHERLKNRVLTYVTGLEHTSVERIATKEKIRREKVKLTSGHELDIEEVITIQGEKKKPTEAKKVLVIDDEPILTDLLADVLERMNYKSEIASCGKTGVEMFEKDSFDLVITDLGMPDISGWEVSQAVKQNKPEVPVVIITGWGIDPDPNKMKEAKVDFIINKPFQIGQLEKIIKELLEK